MPNPIILIIFTICHNQENNAIRITKIAEKIARQVIEMALQQEYQNGLDKMDSIIFGKSDTTF